MNPEETSEIASLAKTLGKGPKHTWPIKEETVKLASGAYSNLYKAVKVGYKYEFSDATMKAGQKALEDVQTFKRKYSREARAKQRLLKARKAAKQTLGKLAVAQDDLIDALRPSQEEPEPEDGDGPEEEEVDDSDVNDTEFDIENSESEDACADFCDGGDGGDDDDDRGPDGGAKGIKKAPAKDKPQREHGREIETESKAAASPAAKSASSVTAVPASPARSDASSATLVMGSATGDRYSSIVVGSFAERLA